MNNLVLSKCHCNEEDEQGNCRICYGVIKSTTEVYATLGERMFDISGTDVGSAHKVVEYFRNNGYSNAHLDGRYLYLE